MISRITRWLFDDPTGPALSPDLFPRVTLRHWLAASGSGQAAYWLAYYEARRRRLACLGLSGGQGGGASAETS